LFFRDGRPPSPFFLSPSILRAADFTTDDMILAKAKKLVSA